MEENLMIFSNKTEAEFNFLRFKPALNWNRFFEDLTRGSNALNSDLGKICQKIRIKLKVFKFLILKLSLFF